MEVMASRLLREWQKASSDLGFTIIAPFELGITDDVTIRAELLVPSFGGRNGMLIVKNYEVVKLHVKALQELGYGFCVFDEPADDSEIMYQREVFIEMLSDWSWAGPAHERPAWIVDRD